MTHTFLHFVEYGTRRILILMIFRTREIRCWKGRRVIFMCDQDECHHSLLIKKITLKEVNFDISEGTGTNFFILERRSTSLLDLCSMLGIIASPSPLCSELTSSSYLTF